MNSEGDKEFLEFVVKSLVDYPDDVKVDRAVDEMGVLMTLDVNREDMGKIIGRNGNTAKAIRTLLRVVGMKNQARVNLKINEPEGSTRGHNTPDAPVADAPVADAPAAPQASDASVAVDEAMEELKADA